VASLVPFVDTTEEDYDRVLNINTKGAFLVCKAVAKAMQQQDSTTVSPPRHGPRDLGRGCIINVASAYSFAAASMKAPYTTSKHALLGITKACGQYEQCSSIDRRRC
jgi:NAD(P)-dependent dehydrogenase (short-subunit alcohol dehydrogenase family)